MVGAVAVGAQLFKAVAAHGAVTAGLEAVALGQNGQVQVQGLPVKLDGNPVSVSLGVAGFAAEQKLVPFAKAEMPAAAGPGLAEGDIGAQRFVRAQQAGAQNNPVGVETGAAYPRRSEERRVEEDSKIGGRHDA